MAPTTLGKRKRQVMDERKMMTGNDADSSDGGEEDAQAVFKRHFEAHFKPLPVVKKTGKVVDEPLEEEYGEETDWNGVSEPEDDDPVQIVEVVEHTAYKAQIAAMSKAELKKFMSSKPPSATPSTSISNTQASATPPEDDLSEAAHLKHDLALQRLITESHLLDSSTNPTVSGTNRHKATDLRMQALGSKKSILTQEKMPASHRRGIIAKKAEREERRRREARENGIILEKAKGNTKRQNEGKRDRGIGGPGVGRFSGGTLTLSKKDILHIEGPRKSFNGRDGKGGRGRTRGGEGKRGKS